ncbi:hypothetical protein BGZ46_005817 [Entomortierella lignicola]|nr:hypothetical protein BGZ46_005817 [Entomortierella lignicola]
MERQHFNKVTKVSELVDVPSRSPQPVSNGPFSPNSDLVSFEGGNGNNNHNNGNGYASSGYVNSSGNSFNGVVEGKRASPSHNGSVSPVSGGTTSPLSQADPFADEPFFTAGPADVAAAVKMGKRTDNQDKVFDASAFFKQQQLEQEQIQALKNNQRALYEQQQQQQYNNGTGSSQGGSNTIPVSNIPQGSLI